MSNSLCIFSKRFKQIRCTYKLHETRLHSDVTNSEKLFTPDIKDLAAYLKKVESKWKMKLMRRFDRERYVVAKDELTSQKLPRYILSMFPYPSGRLHLGHVRIYTSGDILTRYSKLLSQNKKYSQEFSNVIHPMGFDSFGLPAENAAKERGLNPAAWTNSNIRSMKQQLDDLALQLDWREATSNPNFYKWTQEIFLRLMKAGLVYKSFALVNWDPIDKTVLADEQVDENGHSWRSGAKVEKRNYRQWFIKVNAFVNDIYNADEVDPESWSDILAIQRHWVGRPSGWLFYLPVKKSNFKDQETLLIFTSKPELFLKIDTKLLISKDHWLEKVYKISEEGFIANPFTGGQLGIEFTEELDKLPTNCRATLLSSLVNDENQQQINRDQVILQAKLNGLGGYYTSNKYRDWLVSRQRYWGTPIPVARCSDCGYRGVPEHSLPVKLPIIQDFRQEQSSNQIEIDNDDLEVTSPLKKLAPSEWLETKCPTCNSKSKRECETFDTLFDSSWYFLRYASSPRDDKPFDDQRVQPVWCYIGGKEHADMHLFYARFITHFLHSQGALKFREPFRKLLVQGVVKSRTYLLNGKYLSKESADKLEDKSKLVVAYEKMSKSKGNGVDPQDLLDKYGIDATRLCLMSYANPRTERLWRNNQEEFKDVLLHLRRLILTVQEYVEAGDTLTEKRDGMANRKFVELTDEELESRKSKLISTLNHCSSKAIRHLNDTYQFRQYISVIHVLLNKLRLDAKSSIIYTKEYAETLAALIIMQSPITPHLCEELWVHFSNSRINPLRNDSTSSYNCSLQVNEQPWPLPESNK